MTLINCPECKNVISEYAEICVHCGCLLNKKAATDPVKVIVEHDNKNSLEVKSEPDNIPVMLTIKEAAELSGLPYAHIRQPCLEDKIGHIELLAKQEGLEVEIRQTETATN